MEHVFVKNGYEGPNVIILDDQCPDRVARGAWELIRGWNVPGGVPDGEDSAGRARIRPVTPKETVDRAFDISKEYFDRCERDGHMLNVPQPQEKD